MTDNFSTKAVHAGEAKRKLDGALTTPIVQTSTYTFADTGEILGAAILSVEGGEVMTVLQMAMMGRLPYTVLKDAVFAHPTLSESLNNLFGALES